MNLRTAWIYKFSSATAVAGGTATFGKWRDLGFATIVTLGIPYAATIVIPFFAFLRPAIDPNNYWFLPTIHQIAAAFLTFVAIRTVSGQPFSNWGINMRNTGRNLLLTVIFAAVVTVPIYCLAESAPTPNSGIRAWEIVAILGTHLLIIGTTQEILYRGFAMGFLSKQWALVYHFGKWEFPLTGLLSTVIFTISHIKPYPPFIWPEQLMLSFVFGIFYSVMYHRTGSLLGPSLAHGYSNAAYVAMLMLKYA